MIAFNLGMKWPGLRVVPAYLSARNDKAAIASIITGLWVHCAHHGNRLNPFSH